MSEENEVVEEEVVEEVVEEGEEDHSYFNAIIKDLDEDSKVMAKMKKLSNSDDLVESMKKHWDKQNDKIVLKPLKREFKNKITEKANGLKQHEHEWRGKQTELLEKEEEIRREERELKKIVREFLKLHKEDKPSESKKKPKKKKVLKKKKPKKK